MNFHDFSFLSICLISNLNSFECEKKNSALRSAQKAAGNVVIKRGWFMFDERCRKEKIQENSQHQFPCNSLRKIKLMYSSEPIPWHTKSHVKLDWGWWMVNSKISGRKKNIDEEIFIIFSRKEQIKSKLFSDFLGLIRTCEIWVGITHII